MGELPAVVHKLCISFRRFPHRVADTSHHEYEERERAKIEKWNGKALAQITFSFKYHQCDNDISSSQAQNPIEAITKFFDVRMDFVKLRVYFFSFCFGAPFDRKNFYFRVFIILSNYSESG